jgi:hypothetical protein
MLLPKQAGPVDRLLVAYQPDRSLEGADSGVSPAGDCADGHWCCNIRGRPLCVPCTSTIFGRCLNPHNDLCYAAGGTPDNRC